MEKKFRLLDYWPLGIVFLAILSIIIMTVIALNKSNREEEEYERAKQESREWYQRQQIDEAKQIVVSGPASEAETTPNFKK